MARRTEKRSLFGLLVALAAVMVLLAAQVKPAVASVDGRYTDGIRDAVRGVLLKSNRSVLAGLVRLLFHDCFVGGCDGSVMLLSTPTNPAGTTERNSSRNDNLRGLPLIQEIRVAIGGPISCADAIVFAAREATFILSNEKIAYPIDGPGRPDSLKSSKADADDFLPGSTDSFAQLLDNFKKGGRTGFGVKELVVLSSTHGIGVCHKPSFQSRFTEPADQINTTYRAVIITEATVLNPIGPYKNNVRDMGALATASLYGGTLVTGDLLDNSYYTAVDQNMNRFKSDWELRVGGKEATDLLDKYRKSFDDWKADFIPAMTKLSQLKSKGPFQGGVRTDCTRTN